MPSGGSSLTRLEVTVEPTVSENGWPVLPFEYTHLWQVPGVARHLRLAPGAPGFLLTHLVLWFHERVEPIGGGPWDDWAWSEPRPISGSAKISNHCAGVAVDLNALVHPLGSRNTFRPEQENAIRRRLRRVYRGRIRWGVDYAYRADEMHFEIASARSEVVALANRLRFSPRGRRILSRNAGVGSFT
jgi:hypothetical protein